ncbi:hypothetical protein SAMN05444278_1243, partial [Psychroflexus salarius]
FYWKIPVKSVFSFTSGIILRMIPQRHHSQDRYVQAEKNNDETTKFDNFNNSGFHI